MTEREPAIHRLSPLDHVMPHHHVPKLLYFAVTSPPATINATLRIALDRTLAAIPVLSGSITTATHEGQRGSMSVQGPHLSAEEILTAKDLRDTYDYGQLHAKHFPTDVLAPEHITPDLTGKPMQVMLAQANFLRGGLLLFFAVHHCVMDEVGLFNTLKVWSAFCRGDDGSLLVQPEWMDRGPLMQGAGSGRLEDHPTYKLRGEISVAEDSKKPTQYFADSSHVGTAIFFFSDKSLEALKRAATNSKADQTGEGTQSALWTSTNDALCAFLWYHITAARRIEGMYEQNDAVSTLNMAINARSHCSPPISSDYCGNAVMVSKASNSMKRLLSRGPSHLADIALVIRKSVLAVGDAHIKDVIQMIRSVPDISRLAPQGPPAEEETLGCSSWAKKPYYKLDWGDTIGGRCQRVRWRRLRTDGLFVIFPHIDSVEGSMSGTGGLEVCLGLQQEHLRRLKNDKEFGEFAQWRCS